MNKLCSKCIIQIRNHAVIFTTLVFIILASTVYLMSPIYGRLLENIHNHKIIKADLNMMHELDVLAAKIKLQFSQNQGVDLRQALDQILAEDQSKASNPFNSRSPAFRPSIFIVKEGDIPIFAGELGGPASRVWEGAGSEARHLAADLATQGPPGQASFALVYSLDKKSLYLAGAVTYISPEDFRARNYYFKESPIMNTKVLELDATGSIVAPDPSVVHQHFPR